MKKLFITGLLLLALNGCGTTSKETIEETNPLNSTTTYSAEIKIESQQRMMHGYAYGYPNFIWKKYESYSWNMEIDKNVIVEELLVQGNKFATLSITKTDDDQFLFIAEHYTGSPCSLFVLTDAQYQQSNYVNDPDNNNFRVYISVKVSPDQDT